jgi:hypothetical protein
MKPDTQQCPDCGAVLPVGETCEQAFHQMLFWEAEDPPRGEVHHLMVLCYHLQHPGLYSPDGLREAIRLLAAFVEDGLNPQDVRRANRSLVDSGKRTWKIKGSPGSRGSYPNPVRWTMTAWDVVGGGPENYIENVRRWALSVHEAIK